VRRIDDMADTSASTRPFDLIGAEYIHPCPDQVRNRAAAKVKDAVVQMWRGGASLDAVDISSLEVGFQRAFREIDHGLPQVAKINDAAYWDYQRSKVYVRTDKTIRRTFQEAQDRSKNVAIEKEVVVGVIPETCSKCNAAELQMRREGSYVAYDLKRWVVRYLY